MPTLPEPCSKETLLAVLDDIRFHVEQDDSFEGFVEYLMPYPEPCPECRKIESGVPDPDCEVCGGKGEVDYPDGVDFLLRASYRIGNTMGQGGMRMIGRMEPKMATSGPATETEDG